MVVMVISRGASGGSKAGLQSQFLTSGMLPSCPRPQLTVPQVGPIIAPALQGQRKSDPQAVMMAHGGKHLLKVGCH